MKRLILRAIMSKVETILNKTSELDGYPELKKEILEAVEEFFGDLLGLEADNG